MKLLFSEAVPDYNNYVFPYAVWGFPENDETPADFLARGFLPSSKNLERFYLCRSVRVALREFKPSSENRRILRKGGSFRYAITPQPEFDFTPARKELCLQYAAQKFGEQVMTPARLDQLAAAPVTSHFMLFQDAAARRDIGMVLLFLQPSRLAQYYYAFYDLSYAPQNLGMFMMTSAVQHLPRKAGSTSIWAVAMRPTHFTRRSFRARNSSTAPAGRAIWRSSSTCSRAAHSRKRSICSKRKITSTTFMMAISAMPSKSRCFV